ncbi:MAG: hypothetical protein NT075_15115, partial [Chloroflexi bacterium]|nr:hypothetical protein [Chloroflexota bacterium]
MQNYLGVASAVDDLSTGDSWQTTVTGQPPIFGDLGPYTLSFVDGNYSDIITPTVGAGVAFLGDAGNAAVYKDGGNYRTSYWGFGFEALPTVNARKAVLQQLLQWCDFQVNTTITQQVRPPTIARPGQPLTYTLTYSNTGVHLAEQVAITATLPATLTNLQVINSGGTITPVVGAPYRWQVADLAAGQTGMITVTGIISPTLGADTLLTFHASISHQGNNTGLKNHSAQLQTISVIVPRIQLATANLTVSEANGSATLVVQLDQANPYRSIQVNYTTSDGSAQAGSDYTATSGTLTIPAGALTSTFTIPILDDAATETTEKILVYLSNPMVAVLGAPASATVSISDNDATPTSTPTPTATATPTPTPTATVTPGLRLAFAAQPADSSTIHIGDRITYSIGLTNTGELVNQVTVSVTLAAATTLDPTSVTPPTAGGAREARAANTSLVWQLASLATNEAFHASFVVVVN